MDDRRGELDMTWDEVAAAARISVGNLYRIASDPGAAQRMRSTSKKGIERALLWESGSVDTVAEGGEPTRLPTERTAADRPRRPRHEWSARQRAKILAMSFEDALDLAEQIYGGSGEDAAWTWLREAAQLKLEAAGIEVPERSSPN
ncbi:hypothetical protein L3Q65_45845 [Amycolatopsis sp. FU40]|uniref:hypothetical protein n=1 Tax=Amycolatopsis sp. FU40 TaxID=2914159 RepID=UPI001F38F623|nr:hypothetical protein [Amycolatopsis sp. FU40]UKD55098.1 hypothetical protein L3Q65_45845 [Amycolatopsis sp. FU40]